MLVSKVGECLEIVELKSALFDRKNREFDCLFRRKLGSERASASTLGAAPPHVERSFLRARDRCLFVV